MSKTSEGWSVRLSDAAERDWDDIVSWTNARFGSRQAGDYSAALEIAIDGLQGGPEIVGVRTRDDVDRGLVSLSVKLGRRRARHSVFFRVVARVREIVVVRILHDAMEISRHVRPETPGDA